MSKSAPSRPPSGGLVVARASATVSADVACVLGAWRDVTNLVASLTAPSGGIVRAEVQLGQVALGGAATVAWGYKVDGGAWVTVASAYETATTGFTRTLVFEVSGLSAASHSIQIGCNPIGANVTVRGTVAPALLRLTALK